MFRRFITIGICLMMLLLVGCSSKPESAGPATTGAPDNAATKPERAAAEPKELYEQIKTGMNHDEVMAIMAGHKPFLENEGAIDTPTGRITTQNVSWKIRNYLITAIFQDGELLGKDLTKM